MKVKDIEFDHEQLNAFGPNDLYRKCHKELTEDFETVYADFLNKELPATLTDEQITSVKNQKTSFLVAFVSGHLNAFNPTSKFFVKFEVLSGNTKVDTLSGLILPDHLRK